MTRILKLTLLFSFIICTSVSWACDNGGKKKGKEKDKKKDATSKIDSTAAKFPYKLKDPDQKIKLPGYLTEVSGLSFVKEGYLACIQDESGIIFVIDVEKEELAEKIDFGPPGDYEGIELVNDAMWILRSDGTLFEVAGFLSQNPKTTQYETELTLDFDNEGLGLDSESGDLMIACKGFPGQGKKLNKKKTVYAFDMKKKKLRMRPALVIDTKETGEFHPSGIACHPITKNWYIIAARGSKLVVLDQKGQLLKVKQLKQEDFRQPEGIAFDQSGNMYIANEGAGGKAKILRFDYHAP